MPSPTTRVAAFGASIHPPQRFSPRNKFERSQHNSSSRPHSSTRHIHHIAMSTALALTIRHPRPTTVHPRTTGSRTFTTIPRRHTTPCTILLHNYHCPNTFNTLRTSLTQGSQEQGGDNLHPNQLSTHPLQISTIAVNPPLHARAK